MKPPSRKQPQSARDSPERSDSPEQSGDSDEPARSGSRLSRPGARLATGALLLFAALAGLFKIKSYDVFWHLASGRWIADHAAIPQTDPFRFTSHGAAWVDHEWLFQWLLYGAQRVAGLDGLIVLRSAIAVTLTVILLVTARRAGAPPAWAVLAVLPAVLGARPRLFLRPELVTLLCLSLLLLLLAEIRRTRGRRRLVLTGLAVALVVPWANAHPGALAAPIVAAAYLVGTRLPGGRGRRRDGSVSAERVPWSIVVGLPALLAVALVATPNGWEIFAVPFAIGSSLHGLAAVNREWLPLWNPQIARASLYWFSAAAALVALAVVTLRRTGRLDPATGLAAAALATLAASSVRHQALFYVGGAGLASECLAGLARHRSAAETDPVPAAVIRGRRTARLATVLCLLAMVWVLIPPPTGPLAPRQGKYHPGFGLQPRRFPVELADRINSWPTRETASGPRSELGPLYNNVAWGGYLLWRLYPPRQIFVDGRNEVNPELLRELEAARRSNLGWSDLLARYGVDGAVVRYDDRRIEILDPPARPGGEPVVSRHTPHSVFFPRDEFALVAWDDVGMLLVRRTPDRAALLAVSEYRTVRPEDWQWMLEQAADDPAYRRAALADVERRLADTNGGPPCSRAKQLRDALLDLAESTGG